MSNKYIAKLYRDSKLLSSESGANRTQLLIYVLNQLQQDKRLTYGVVLNTMTKRIIHRCRKSIC